MHLYQNILYKMQHNMLALVDNQDFINWSITYNSDGAPNSEAILTEPVAKELKSAYGATSIASVG